MGFLAGARPVKHGMAQGPIVSLLVISWPSRVLADRCQALPPGVIAFSSASAPLPGNCKVQTDQALLISFDGRPPSHERHSSLGPRRHDLSITMVLMRRDRRLSLQCELSPSQISIKILSTSPACSFLSSSFSHSKPARLRRCRSPFRSTLETPKTIPNSPCPLWMSVS